LSAQQNLEEVPVVLKKAYRLFFFPFTPPFGHAIHWLPSRDRKLVKELGVILGIRSIFGIRWQSKD